MATVERDEDPGTSSPSRGPSIAAVFQASRMAKAGLEIAASQISLLDETRGDEQYRVSACGWFAALSLAQAVKAARTTITLGHSTPELEKALAGVEARLPGFKDLRGV